MRLNQRLLVYLFASILVFLLLRVMIDRYHDISEIYIIMSIGWLVGHLCYIHYLSRNSLLSN